MGNNIIGIRREDKNLWERRSPFSPDQIGKLIAEHQMRFVVQSSEIRVFRDEDFRRVGAEVREDLSDCPIVLGIKEMPSSFFRPKGTYMFFAHVIKGQPHNMGMLKRILDLGCSLIDYEKITDDNGKRLVFFGWFAGFAGMIDTLAGLGKRLLTLGRKTPFAEVKLAHQYGSVDKAKGEIRRIGAELRLQGLPRELTPLVIGVTGYGNVARGVGEVLTALGAKEVLPSDLPALMKEGKTGQVYRVVFREEDMVEPKTSGQSFNLNEYFTHPELYQSKFERFLPYLSVLVNCIYWDRRYPRLVTKEYLRANFVPDKFKLIIIGDISCDIEGSVEITVKTTNPGAPFFVYNPLTEEVKDGLEGTGVAIMAVDNLPCELARESSREFGRALVPFMPALARCDFGVDIDQLDLPSPLRRALIVHRGRLTPAYEYLERFIQERGVGDAK